MAHKVSAGGSYRLDKRYSEPVGRLAIATGATTRAAFHNVVACCDRLAQRGRLDVLAAVKAHRITLAQVLDADRRDALDALLASLTPNLADALLWPAVASFLGPANAARDRGPTMRRYATSWKKLERAGVLSKDAPVSALDGLDWPALARTWKGSTADWNHVRRAVSHFLAVHLGDTFHPLRRAVVKAIPRQRERERVPDLDVPTFWQVVNAAPEYVRPAFVALVTLGLRTGEYLRMRETDLHPITHTVNVPGTKTEGSAAVLRVADDMWPWIVAAVPSPVEYSWLRIYWKRALKAVGADVTLRLHDLRHLTAQLLVNAGQSEASVQTTMRHATASMTRRYAMQKDRGENATALARVLLDSRTA